MARGKRETKSSDVCELRVRAEFDRDEDGETVNERFVVYRVTTENGEWSEEIVSTHDTLNAAVTVSLTEF